ncbi:hypothetical protein [uncultured Brevundimonas sp.]|uniref:lipopolysaccharide biosynthesis protein n=1 Tax=uncultured Brevundimonas sp. TaxID=213418 RepID=UPI0026119BFA|nr:hypothetical protein [uncultured Brevundimonas sp.]
MLTSHLLKLRGHATVKDLLLPIVTVAGGRAFGQVVIFLSTLFAARYFSPSDFGQVGLFTSIVALGAAASGLRLEIRAQVTQLPVTKATFFALAYISNGLVMVVAYAGIGLYAVISGQGISPYAALVPIAIFATSLNLYILPAQHAHPPRPRTVGLMAQVNAWVIATTQILAALFLPNPLLLALARTLGPATGSLVALRTMTETVSFIPRIAVKRALRLIRTSYKEIILGMPANAISTIAFQIPVYVFSARGMSDETGIYWFAFNLLFSPYTVISSSLRPIYLAKIRNTRRRERYDYLVKSTLIAYALGIGFVLLAAVPSFVVTRFFLGPEWIRSSNYIMLLCPMLACLIGTLPLGASISITNQQTTNLIHNIAQVVLRAAAMISTLYLFHDGGSAILAFSLVSMTLSIAFTVWSLAQIRTSSDRAIAPDLSRHNRSRKFSFRKSES